MRLTLRTMLAYMDGILESEDAEEIGKKIEESEYASTLLHRTRDVMRRLRLAVPAAAGRGAGLDANTVAEYLDHTLDDDRVTDFEKVCLDSDVHLAEVASCHQILTLVLGEAAEIDPAARQRMYQLPDLLAAQTAVETVPPAVPPAVPPGFGDGQSRVEPPPLVHRQKPTVPDYLREPRRPRRLLPVAAALVLIGAIAAAALIFTGTMDVLLAQIGLGQGETEVAGAPDQEQPTATEEEKTVSPPDDPTPPTGPADPEDSPPVAPLPEDLEVPPGPLDVVVAPNDVPPLPGDLPADLPPVPLDDVPPLPLDNVPPVLPGNVPPVLPGNVPPETPVPPVEPQRMGRFMSDGQVLLWFDAESDTWGRVPAKTTLYPDIPLVALPTYRDEILLSSGISVQLLGGSKIELLPGADPVPVGMKVHYGRALLMPPVADAGKKLRLVAAQHTGTITFGDAESVLALEVIPVHFEGMDPEASEPSAVVNLYVQSGHVLWDEGGDPVLIIAGNALVVSDDPDRTAVTVKTVPSWISGNTISPLDRRASVALQQSVSVDRSARLGLMELNDQRREVRWLAARCLAHIGDFDSLLAALNDEEHRAAWPDWEEHFKQLRGAVSRGPETAVQLREALQKQYPEEAAALYPMFWGYTEEGLRGGDAQELIEHLDHGVLAVRVVSYLNLYDIFGLGLQYEPAETAAKRRAPMQKWNERLESGELWEKLRLKAAKPPT